MSLYRSSYRRLISSKLSVAGTPLATMSLKAVNPSWLLTIRPWRPRTLLAYFLRCSYKFVTRLRKFEVLVRPLFHLLFYLCVTLVGRATRLFFSVLTMATFDFAGITTVFEPNPTCFAPSNLWTSTMLCSVGGGGYAARAVNPKSFTCPLTILGPPTTSALHSLDHSCYPWYDDSAGKTAWSDCPAVMTAALETTYDFGNGVTSMETYCCPS